MHIKLITRTRHNLWLFFPFLIACCFIIEPVEAKLGSNPVPKRGITIDDLAAIRDIYSITLSPDGKYVAYQIIQADKDQNEYNISWHVVATIPGSTAKKIADGGEISLSKQANGLANGDFEISEIIWSLDSKWIYFTRKYNGTVQLWRKHRLHGNALQLTHNAGDVKNLKIPLNKTIKPSGTIETRIFFTVGRTHAEIKSLITQEAQQGYVQEQGKYMPKYTVMKGPIIPNCLDCQRRSKNTPLAGVKIHHLDVGQGCPEARPAECPPYG